MLQSSPELADALIARLSELCEKPEAQAVLGRMIEKRIAAPMGAFASMDETHAVGLLHVLNSLVGLDENGHGLIAAVYTDEGGYFAGFRRYTAPAAPLAPAALPEPAAPKAEEQAVEAPPKSKAAKAKTTE